LQNCDGRFQIEPADRAWREYGRRYSIIGRMRRISGFASEFDAPRHRVIENSQ